MHAPRLKLLRTLLLGLTLCVVPPLIPSLGTQAQTLAAPADTRAVQAVIVRQIEAFGKDDALGAFAVASQDVRDTFGDAVTFALMVQAQYPMVYRPRNYQFEAALLLPEGLVQGVLFEDRAGGLVRALYLLVREGGSWKIGGVYLLPLEDPQLEGPPPAQA